MHMLCNRISIRDKLPQFSPYSRKYTGFDLSTGIAFTVLIVGINTFIYILPSAVFQKFCLGLLLLRSRSMDDYTIDTNCRK